jgi:hypothetical protein
VGHVVRRADLPGVSIVSSDHSLDVLAPTISKATIIQQILATLSDRSPAGKVLAIGDRGRWPGNDFSLLLGPNTLSVDIVSPDPESCWNLAPPGVRGSQATLHYLSALTIRNGLARLSRKLLLESSR